MLNAVITITALAGLCGVGLGVAGRRLAGQQDPIAERIDALLPQTQCGQCGYPGCRPYAEAVARGEAPINLCTPGGNATMHAIAELLQVDPEPVAEDDAGPAVAVIDEDRCIGCARCLPACPVDAIVGAQRHVHTVIAEECTGCRLCLDACPMDCIEMQPVEPPPQERVRPLPTPAASPATQAQRPGPVRHREVRPAPGGGVLIGDAKPLSRGEPRGAVPLPGELVLPLTDHAGNEQAAAVAAGAQVRRGTPLTHPSGAGVPLHAPTSGRVKALERRPAAHPAGGRLPCLILEADGADTPEAPLAPMPAPLAQPAEALLERIREAGVRGMGGATFPTSLKLADGRDHGVDTLVVNAVECDTYLTCDEALLRERTDEVLSGARIAAAACGASRILVALKAGTAEAAAAVRAAIAGSGAEGVEIVEVPPRYPAGNERHLVYPATGRTVPAGGRPSIVGVVCQNVSTLAAVHRAVVHGEPVVERLVTVTGGAASAPGNYAVRIGTPLAALAGADAAAATRTLVGGGVMNTPVSSLQIPVTHGTSGLVLESEAEAPLPEQPCIRCGVCAEVCPEGLRPYEILARVRAGIGVGEAAPAVDLDPMRCSGCSSCELICPSSAPLTGVLGHARDAARAQMRERERAERARQRYEAKQAREERRRREREAARQRKRQALRTESAGQDRRPETPEG